MCICFAQIKKYMFLETRGYFMLIMPVKRWGITIDLHLHFFHLRWSMSSEIPGMFLYLVIFSGVRQTLWRIQSHWKLTLNGSSKEMVSFLWNMGDVGKLEIFVSLTYLFTLYSNIHHSFPFNVPLPQLVFPFPSSLRRGRDPQGISPLCDISIVCRTWCILSHWGQTRLPR